MARPLRIEFPGALYHITSRSNARQRVFHEVSTTRCSCPPWPSASRHTRRRLASATAASILWSGWEARQIVGPTPPASSHLRFIASPLGASVTQGDHVPHSPNFRVPLSPEVFRNNSVIRGNIRCSQTKVFRESCEKDIRLLPFRPSACTKIHGAYG